jgi:putative spermidine/putrescine transport system ATP-binding protein
VTLTARPEHMSVATARSPGSLPGVVDAVLPVGPSLIYEIVLKDGTPVKVSEPREKGRSELPRGTEVFVELPREQCQIFADGKRAIHP